MKPATANLLLACASLALSFAAAEFALRIIGYQATSQHLHPDPQTGLLRYGPHAEFRQKTACYDERFKANRLGFHAKEFDEKKPEGTFRIAVYGDSFVEAAQVPVEESFAARLEEKLNAMPERTMRYEVVPFGISSNGTYMNGAYWNAYRRAYAPDLVIDALYMNDVSDDAAPPPGREPVYDASGTPAFTLAPTEPPTLLKRLRSVLRRSAVVYQLSSAVSLYRYRQHSAPEALPVEYGLMTEPPAEDAAKALDLQGRLLSGFAGRVRADGARFMVMAIPEGFLVHPSLFDRLPDGGRGYDASAVDRRLAEMAEREHLDLLALAPAFRARLEREPEGMTVWSCDGHWNATGHAWAADALYGYLTAHPKLLNR